MRNFPTCERLKAFHFSYLNVKIFKLNLSKLCTAAIFLINLLSQVQCYVQYSTLLVFNGFQFQFVRFQIRSIHVPIVSIGVYIFNIVAIVAKLSVLNVAMLSPIFFLPKMRIASIFQILSLSDLSMLQFFRVQSNAS